MTVLTKAKPRTLGVKCFNYISLITLNLIEILNVLMTLINFLITLF